MDIKKLETKLNNYKRIETKVNNDKNILLIDMMKQNQLMLFYVKNAEKNQNVILYLKKQFGIKNTIISKNDSVWNKNKFLNAISSPFSNKKELWIYLTEEQKFATDSYSRYEDSILQATKKKNVDFITIGKRAHDFCINNKLNVVYATNNEIKGKELSKQLSQIVKFLFLQENYLSLNFVINSNKNKNGHFTILPIDKFNIGLLHTKKEEEKEIVLNNYKIYPNIDSYLDNQIYAFIRNSIQSLIVESSFYKAKIALITTNKIINEVEEEIKSLHKKIIRIKRENEIEEISLLTSNNKTNFLNKTGDK